MKKKKKKNENKIRINIKMYIETKLLEKNIIRECRLDPKHHGHPHSESAIVNMEEDLNFRQAMSFNFIVHRNL